MPEVSAQDLIPQIDATLSELSTSRALHYKSIIADTKPRFSGICHYHAHCQALVLINFLRLYLEKARIAVDSEFMGDVRHVSWTFVEGDFEHNIVCIDALIQDLIALYHVAENTALVAYQLNQRWIAAYQYSGYVLTAAMVMTIIGLELRMLPEISGYLILTGLFAAIGAVCLKAPMLPEIPAPIPNLHFDALADMQLGVDCYHLLRQQEKQFVSTRKTAYFSLWQACDSTHNRWKKLSPVCAAKALHQIESKLALDAADTKENVIWGSLSTRC